MEVVLTTEAISDFIDVRSRASDLGLEQPADLALLPCDYELLEPGGIITIAPEAATLRKLLSKAGVAVQVLGAGSSFGTRIRKSGELVWPIMFIGVGAWMSHPLAVQVVLDVMSSMAADMLRGVVPKRNVHVAFAVECKSRGTTKRLEYDGPPDGLRHLEVAIRRLAHE